MRSVTITDRTRAGVLLLLFVVAPSSVAQVRDITPEAAEAEVKHSIELAFKTANRYKGLELFVAAARPYGPLDLVVGKSPDASYSATIRNFFYGAVAGAAGISQEKATSLPSEFHCGPPCAEARMRKLTAHLEAIRAIVAQFKALQGVDVLAAWPGGDFRVAELIYTEGQFVEMKPSPGLGLRPWDTRPVEMGEARLAKLGTDRDRLSRLVASMRNAGITAVVGEGGAVRAVMSESIGPNEAGLLFVTSKGQLPRIDARQLDGRRVVAMVELSEGLYFYTST